MPMRVEIITAEREVYSDDVDVLTAPGMEGELGILPNHAPLMTALQPGEIMLRKDGEETYLAVSGGFMEVIANRVMILADACERDDEIDEQRAQVAVQRAQERPCQPHLRPGSGTRCGCGSQSGSSCPASHGEGVRGRPLPRPSLSLFPTASRSADSKSWSGARAPGRCS